MLNNLFLPHGGVGCAGQAGFKVRLFIQLFRLIDCRVMVLIPVGFRANERHPSDQTTVKVFGTVRLSTPPLFAIGDQIAIIE